MPRFEMKLGASTFAFFSSAPIRDEGEGEVTRYEAWLKAGVDREIESRRRMWAELTRTYGNKKTEQLNAGLPLPCYSRQ